MVDIVLVEPEIPNNTGAIARTCACTGSRLHLVKPLGFDISDRAVKRAGLDYWHLVDISVYENIDEYFAKNGDENLWLLTTKASVSYVDADLYPERDAHVRQGDKGPAGVAARALCRSLPAHPHARGGAQPESVQHCGDLVL